jgi:diguanylate cyclase (GGDEF)-like protein/PAS domain S-box-containing protein
MARTGNPPDNKRPKPMDWSPGDTSAANPDSAAQKERGLGLLALFQTSREPMLVCDEKGIIRFWNAGAEALFGYAASEAMGKAAAMLVEGGWPFPADANVLVAQSREITGLRKDGSGVPTELSQGAFTRDLGGLRLTLARDLSALRQSGPALRDALTGLPSRALMLERLGRALDRVRRNPGALCAALVLDLDRFKMINDSMGHQKGDSMLVAFARRLEVMVPPGTTLARLSGDEFSILIEEFRDYDDAARLADRLQEMLGTGFDLDGQEVFVAVSIGIAVGTAKCQGPEELLRDAENAMHRAKSSGKGRYEVFDDSMHTKAVHMMTLETDLRRALERMEFRLHYQPIVSLRDSGLKGFEALIRWNHPKLGMVPPLDFIPLAEDTGLIIPIGRWVLWQSCKQLVEWQGIIADGKSLTMSVNLSGKQLQDADLVRQVRAILQETGLAPGSLKLEVTESAIMENPEKAAAILTSLREQGIHLSLDDFGTGYSSLSYLHRFPFHNLKIDRSFVSKLEAGDKDAEIVKVINSLARNLGMDVVAEGIETEAQWAVLHGLACAYGQGYFFSRPLEDTAARKLIEGGGFASRGPLQTARTLERSGGR